MVNMAIGVTLGLACAALFGVAVVFWMLVQSVDDMATKLQAMVDRDEQQEWDD